VSKVIFDHYIVIAEQKIADADAILVVKTHGLSANIHPPAHSYPWMCEMLAFGPLEACEW
jgi:hypothetical protein